MEQSIKKASSAIIKQKLSAQNISLTVIGVGQSELVNIPSFNNQYVTDSNGLRVLSRQDTQWLKQLNSVRLYDENQLEGKTIADLIKLPKAQFNKQDKDKILWNEWFFIPLLVAFLSLLLATSRFKSRADK